MANFTAIAECEWSFGPVATLCGNQFDFTLLFEQSILNIGPSAVLLLVLPLRLQQLFHQRRKVLRHPSNVAKIAACIVFGGLQIALLTLWAQAPHSDRVSIAAAVLGVLDAFALALLSHAEHLRSIRPSTIICVYLAFSLIFDAVQCRTLWLLPGLHKLASVFSAALAVKLTMFVLEVQGKRRFLLAALRHLSPEATSGIVARGFFWWLNSLLGKGFKATLSASTLYDIDEELRSEYLLQKLSSAWNQRRENGKLALLRSLFSMTKMALLSTAIPRLVLIGFRFSQPFLINRIIRYVDGDRGSDPKSIGYSLIAATGLVYLGNALSIGFYQHTLFRYITMIRGSLVSLIMSNNLDLDTTKASDPSAPLTLVSTDVRTICKSFEEVHEVWANPIEIVIATWLLGRQLGLGSIGPAVTVIACTIGIMKLSKLMPRASKIWNEEIQKRITVTSEVLGVIKETKMLGMVDFLQNAIQDLKITELGRAKQYRMLTTYINMLGNAPAMMGPVVTFGLAILAQEINAGLSLSIATVFTSLSIIDLISRALGHLLASVPNLVACLGSFERIQTFLEQARPTVSTDPDYSRTGNQSDRGYAGTDHSLKMHVLPSKNSFGQRNIVSIRRGSFSFKTNEEPILHDINLHILSSTMTIVIGRTGSGKTTLLRGLLGELPSNRSVNSLEGSVAYCAQTTWLTTETVKENIIGQTPPDEDWYERVVHACALVPDFSQLANSDHTVVGSKGHSLSGGQKQRISLARAIFSRKPVLIIDDALGGLDNTTQTHIWDCLFSPRGLIRQYGATVILTTHSLKYLKFADNIVILGDDGRIVSQGDFDTVQESTYLQNLSFENTQSNDIKEVDTKASSRSRQQSQPQSKGVETESDQDLLRKAADTTLYWYYLKSIGWLFGLAGGVTLVLGSFFRVFPHIWLKFWAEEDARAGSAKTALAPLSFFGSTDTGDLINRFSQDLSHIDQDLPIALFMTSMMFLDSLAAAILIFMGAKYLAAAIPFALIALYLLQAFYLRTSRQMRFLVLQAQAPLLTKLIETIDGLSTIRAFGWQAAFRETSLDLLDQSQRPYYLMFCIQRWFTLVLDIIVGAIAILLVSMAMMIPNATSTGAIAIALYNVLNFNQSLATLITSWTELETSLGAIFRLRTFVSRTPIDPTPDAGEQGNIPRHWPSQGLVEIKNITVSYSEETRPVLKGISLSIRPGEKIAICGRTGSGKSTLILAMFKLLGLDAGRILIDGLDISSVPNDLLRRSLIAIPQEPLLFPGTLRTNLFPFSDISSADEVPSDANLIIALTKVSLWPAIFLHGGLDADVSNIPLSKGQKQLLCLARALVRKNSSKVLVLDEATSAVDRETEDMMARVIEREFADHTIISVVHRLQALRGIDRVVTLQDGRVASIEPAEH
ncbi:ABC transporter [Colletotrichum orchidophilum]|uniref:ABC transporter n=1 Tax=Colletotrichum orchidophilum TaxID=1209926 RepID=A0A1G4BAR0_9PEZI|nr:ABC transporter [Colletotrichum orchidophilum]OHE98497.1 ABC transporter [Colletotrichum orchidophilum]